MDIQFQSYHILTNIASHFSVFKDTDYVKVQGQVVKHVYLSTFDIRRVVLRISSDQDKSSQACCSVPLTHILTNTLLL